MKLLLYIAMMLMAVICRASIDSPTFTCVTVNGSDVTLTWSKVIDPGGEFLSYDIYTSGTSEGAFTLLSSINNLNQLSYTSSGNNFATNDYFYYIVTVYDDGSGAQPSTQIVKLQVVEMTVSNHMVGVSSSGSAVVTWNSIQSDLSSYGDSAALFSKPNFAGVWTFVDSVAVGATTYTDHVNICEDSIYYKVEYTDNNGCVSASVPGGELIEDDLAPGVTIDSVSVDVNTGGVIISWTPDGSSDYNGALIAHEEGNSFTLYDPPVIGATTFTDLSVNTSTQSHTYGINPFDDCLKGNPPSYNIGGSPLPFHETMFLQQTIDPCERTVDLAWTPYIGWTAGISKYQVYVSENNGPFVSIADLSGATFTYQAENLVEGNSYCYFVRAVESGMQRTSSSNKVCTTVSQPTTPQFHYLTKVSVNESNQVELKCYVDPSAEVAYYLIKRTQDPSVGYQVIDDIPNTGINIIEYVDQSAQPKGVVYYYQVVTVDICGNEKEKSNLSNNIRLLTTSNAVELSIKLDWGDYNGWTAGSDVAYFNIYRSVDGVYETTPIALVGDSVFTYTDDVSSFNRSDGTFCYYVEAVESAANMYDFKERSNSNRACGSVSSSSWMPNAFSPNGNSKNETIKPTLNFIDVEEYNFYIFNRWGEQLFHTTDLDQSWDGGSYPTGVYVYYIRYKDSYGNYQDKRGPLTLLR